MNTKTRSVSYIVLSFFFLSLSFAALLTNPAQAEQIAQADEQKPKPKPAEEEHNDEDDC